MRSRAVPHNRPPRVLVNEQGKRNWHDRACCGDRRRGPAGMMLAAELALAKVDVAVVERRRDHALVGSRAGGFQSRTIEVLDQRGVADRFWPRARVFRSRRSAGPLWT